MKELLEARDRYLKRFPKAQDPMDVSASVSEGYLIKKLDGAKKPLVFKQTGDLDRVVIGERNVKR